MSLWLSIRKLPSVVVGFACITVISGCFPGQFYFPLASGTDAEMLAFHYSEIKSVMRLASFEQDYKFVISLVVQSQIFIVASVLKWTPPSPSFTDCLQDGTQYICKCKHWCALAGTLKLC